MARLILQMAAASVNATSTAPSAAHDGSGIGKSGIIYTFTFIGASVLAGLLFLGLMMKYIIKYGMWRSPVTIPLQAGAIRSDCTAFPVRARPQPLLRIPIGLQNTSIA